VNEAVEKAARRVELMDTTADGKPDTLAVDVTGDGVVDTLIPLRRSTMESDKADDDVTSAARRAELLDTTGDGKPDTLAVDTVGDGVADKFVRLQQASSEAPASTNPSPGSERAVARAASRVELVDTTADGRPDAVAVDTVGDGVADTLIPLKRTASSISIADDVAEVLKRAELIDTTGDGRPDTLAVDTEGVGKPDKMIPLKDINTPSAARGAPTPPPSPPAEPSPPSSPSAAENAVPRAGAPKGVSPKNQHMAAVLSPKLKVGSAPGSPKPETEGRRWSLSLPSSTSAAPTAASSSSGARWSLIGTKRTSARTWGAGDKSNAPLSPALKPAEVEPPAAVPMTPEEILESTPLIKDLGAFVAKYGLDPSASSELQELMIASCRDALVTQQARSGPVCRWDQIHEMILSHSPDTSLVIVNLPDPPELAASAKQLADGKMDEKMAELVQYMEYMEGLAEGLPRVLYVHGSGQEIINLDQME